MQEIIRFALLGLGIGAMYSLAAQGLVLIYRGSGVLNFAHGAIGVVGAYLAWELQTRHGLPFGVAFTVGVLASALIGALTHLLVMRPLRHASSTARVVGTVGVLITLQAAVVLRYGPVPTFVQPSLPQNVWHIWGSVVISADRVILVAIAAVLSVVLGVIYKRTRFGLATAAVAESQRSAAAVGLSPDAIAIANWALGSALAGAAAILVTPILTLQAGSMTSLVLAATAAALVAGFRSFPIAFAAGMGIGVAQTEIARYWSTQTGADKAVPLVVIVAYLVLTGRALPLRDYFLQRLPSVGSGRVRPGPLLLSAGAGAALIGTASLVWVDAFTVTLSVALVLLSIVVVTGYTGQLSFAQYTIAGVGAFIAGRLVATQGWPFWAALLAGVVGTVPIGLAFAVPAVRTRGINLAIVTLGLGTAIELVVFNNGNWTGSFAGTIIGHPTLFGWSIDSFAHPRRYAFVCFAAYLVATLAVANMRRGRTGRRLLAVRTNERAAAALGVNVAGAKLYAFGVSSAIAALGGILIGFQAGSISYSQTYTNFTSIAAVGWAFLGGIGYLAGPLVGAALAPGAAGTAISNSLLSGFARWLPLIGGISVIGILLSDANGIVAMNIKTARTAAAVLRRLLRRPPAAPRRIVLGEATRERVEPRTLEVRGLTVRYGSVTAVDDVSLIVRPGTILGLIGPNGSGKTSAIDSITGFTKAAGGSIHLNDKPVDSWPVVRRVRAGISRSFQSLELFEDATVFDNLRVASDPRDLASYLGDLVFPTAPPLSAEAIAAIREFGLEDDLERRVEELPYGKRRLLAIARAVAARPSVLLLDEPASGLSELESRELAHLIRRLADDWGLGVLLVEHDMTFVMSICDEVVVLDHGRSIGSGPPDLIRRDPAVIAAYLGAAPDEGDRPPAGFAQPESLLRESSRLEQPSPGGLT